MALENIAEIEKSLGIEQGKLAEMVTSEEVHKIDLESKVIMEKTIFDERIENIKKETAQTALEMAVKEKKRELGLDFVGKNIDGLVNAIKEKTEAESKIEPEEKFKSLKSDFDKLQKNFETKNQEFEAFKTNIEIEKSQNEIKSEFTKNIPDNVLVSKSTIFTEAKEKGFSFAKEEGVIVVKKNGETLKNEQTLSPIGIDAWAKEFATPYLGKPNGGAGAGDDKPQPQAGSFEAFEKESIKNGWSDAQKNIEMSKRINNGTLKM